jgi:uncharacterized membrane-anchored protein
MILTQLLCMVFLIAPFCALDSATRAGEGYRGYILAIIVGLLVGVSCAWALWISRKVVLTRTAELQPSRRNWYLRALYFSALLWVFVSCFLGNWITASLLRLAF